MHNPFNLNTRIKKSALAAALILLGLFLLFLKWLPFPNALGLSLLIPFLYFTPGYFLTKILFSTLNALETAILAALLSALTVNLGIFTVEEITKQMGLAHIVIIALTVNALSLAAFMTLRRRLPTRLLARLRGKLHKGD